MTTEKTNQQSTTVDEILDALKQIAETETVEHVVEDGVFKGTLVTYKNPLLPELKTVFHPYIPLQYARISE